MECLTATTRPRYYSALCNRKYYTQLNTYSRHHESLSGDNLSKLAVCCRSTWLSTTSLSSFRCFDLPYFAFEAALC